MTKRNTIQKELVLSAVRTMKRHVTAEEVYEWIVKDYPSIGKGTVYRNLHSLSEEGEIKKIDVPGGPDCYDFTLTDHYHMKCVQCHQVYDIDMKRLPELKDKVHNVQGDPFYVYDIMIQGLCYECQ